MLSVTVRPGATLAIWGPRMNRRTLGHGDLPRPGTWHAVRDDKGTLIGRIYRKKAGEAGKGQPVVRLDLPDAYRVERSDAARSHERRERRR